EGGRDRGARANQRQGAQQGNRTGGHQRDCPAGGGPGGRARPRPAGGQANPQGHRSPGEAREYRLQVVRGPWVWIPIQTHGSENMPDQSHYWSLGARAYEEEYIDPYRPDVRSPLLPALRSLAGQGRDVAALGCGIGPLLPFLAEHFRHVYAVDF